METDEKTLLARMPRNLALSFRQQRRDWEVLFPAERRLCDAQLDWLGRLSAKDLEELFAPVQALEARSDLSRLDREGSLLSIADTGMLARSPLYPQWRVEVQRVFARIEAGIANDPRLKPRPRFITCLLPAGLPVQGASLWSRIAAQGRWVMLSRTPAEFLPGLVQGLAGRRPDNGLEPVERDWLFESDSRFAQQRVTQVVLSYTELEPVRRRFLSRLNIIQKDLRSADAALDDLRAADLKGLMPEPLHAAPLVREFARTLLLSGNGAMVFGNSFVQWGASEALRRVQPQTVIARFGLRNRLKPFSSIIFFEDQNRNNPVPDVPDPAGSLTDAELLSEYVILSAHRLAPYRDRTICLLAVEDQNRALLLEPPQQKIVSDMASGEALDPGRLQGAIVSWLQSGGNVASMGSP
jgi:hypothetical protein